MAINPSTETQYQGAVNAPDAGYPFGSARNDASPGDLTGTPRVANEVNDLLGFFQSVLDRNGNTPNGTPESVTNPQILDALLDLSAPVTVPVSGRVFNLPGQGAFAEYIPPAGATEVTYTIRVENADPASLSRLNVYSRTNTGANLVVETHDQYGLARLGITTTHTTKLAVQGANVADRVYFLNNGSSAGAPSLVRFSVISYTIPKGKM